MELSQLRIFIMVAKECNLTRAAARLFLTPPSVSSRLKSLEDELGVSLFDRSSRGMTLTSAGLELKKQAEQLLHQADQLINHARKLQGSIEGQLRIGLNTSPSSLQASNLVTNLQQQYPQLEISLLPSVSATICDEVTAGRIDAGFVYGQINIEALSVIHLQSTQVIVIAPQGWQHRVHGVSREGLAKQPWIWVSTICPYIHLLQGLFDESGEPANIVASADDEQTTIDLVKAGVGLGIVDRRLAHVELNRGSIFRVDTDSIEIALSLVFARRRQKDPLICVLLQALKQLWPEMHPSSALVTSAFDET